MGMRRTGKTTLMLRLLKASNPKRLIVIDTLRELQQKGHVQSVTLDEMREIMLTKDSYRLGVYPEGEDQFDYVCEAVAARNDITLAIDEMDAWFPTSTHLPPQSLLNISLTGGHYGQELICITHRPSAIHHSIMSQGVLWIFPMYDANDCKSVMSHTRRPGNPNGINPQDVQPTELDGRGWIVATNVARVSQTDIQVLEFNVREGKLYRYDIDQESDHSTEPDNEQPVDEEPAPDPEGETYADVDF